jgi:DNA recombination protein RmuC
MNEILILIIAAVSLCLTAAIFFRLSSLKGNNDTETIRREINSAMQSFSGIINENQQSIGRIQTEKFDDISKITQQLRTELDRRLEAMNTSNMNAVEKIRRENTESLEKLRKETMTQLSEIRQTVDEKLQQTLETRITKSFKLVNDRLEQVYKGLGEMQTLAQGVGDLKKVLTNVKSRGIVGEMQLGSILEQILAPEQYEENIATVPGSKNVVEFAIKLPDRDGNLTYLPIDSKFPADTYTALLDAYDNGDKTACETAAKALRTRILSEAKDIHEKYVSPPSTTDFAIMFLPFEGLYAEVINRGMVEELQNNYRIMIAGPSTMAAMLNSIRMGFKTLAIEKRSAEVWEVLGAVKTEFGKFESILTSTQKRLNQANDELDKLIGVRTRAIVRKLGSVEKLEPAPGFFENDSEED